MTRALAVGGMAAPVLLSLVFVLLGFLRAGYSHITQLGSELGEIGAPNAAVMNTTFVAFGLLTIGLAVGLRRGLHGGFAATAGAALIAAFGVLGGVGAGFFPCDPGCPMPGETFSGIMHNLLVSIGFLALASAPLVLWSAFRRDPRWAPYATYSLVSGLVGLAAFLVFGSGALDAWRGAVQRVMVGVLYAWMLVIGTRLVLLRYRTVRPGWHRG